MSTLLLAFLAAAPAARPTLAVLPPVAIDGDESWLGYVVADNLSADLLTYRKAGKKDYPLNVFSWRETTSAARAEGLDVRKPLSPASQQRLAQQLGARYLFTASYRVKAGKVLLKWRLFDAEPTAKKAAPKELKVTTNLSTLSSRTEALSAAVLKQLGEKPGKGAKAAKAWSADALEAYGRGLEILAQQSLESHAPVVLPAMELKKARLLFEEAVREAPQMWRAHVGLALTSAMLGELDRAEKEVLQAAAHASDIEPTSVLGLYYLQVRRQKIDEAVKTLVDATTKHPGFLGAFGYLGSIYLRTGKAKEAEGVFRAYMDRVPKSPWARIMHSRAVGYSGKEEAALEEMRAVAKDFPESLMVVAALGTRLAQAKKVDEAIAVLQAAIAKHGEHPVLLTRLSYAYLQKGSAQEALSLAQKAVDMLSAGGRGETTAGYAWANLGHALALSGKKPEAMAAFKRASELGIGVEERLLLLADERTKPLMQDPANALATDAPPPPAPAAPSEPAPAPATEEQVPAVGEPEATEVEAWEEEESFDEGEDWNEEAYDDAPEEGE
jgi:tetratricopeptide (TPR) repeat protein